MQQAYICTHSTSPACMTLPGLKISATRSVKATIRSPSASPHHARKLDEMEHAARQTLFTMPITDTAATYTEKASVQQGGEMKKHARTHTNTHTLSFAHPNLLHALSHTCQSNNFGVHAKMHAQTHAHACTHQTRHIYKQTHTNAQGKKTRTQSGTQQIHTWTYWHIT